MKQAKPRLVSDVLVEYRRWLTKKVKSFEHKNPNGSYWGTTPQEREMRLSFNNGGNIYFASEFYDEIPARLRPYVKAIVKKQEYVIPRIK